MFTGYLTQAPQAEYRGWGEQGAVYRYDLLAESDEALLDQKALPNRAPFVARSAGAALRQLAQDLLPGWFDSSAVEDVDTLAAYVVNPEKKFSYHAAEIALAARASYRAMNGALQFGPGGSGGLHDQRERREFFAGGADVDLSEPASERRDCDGAGRAAGVRPGLLCGRWAESEILLVTQTVSAEQAGVD